MIPDNVAIGSLIIILCVIFLVMERWILAKSAKGQWLVRQFGVDAAPWVFRGLILLSIALGVLLALGVIRPLQW